jgi:hypothetical protein
MTFFAFIILPLLVMIGGKLFADQARREHARARGRAPLA